MMRGWWYCLRVFVYAVFNFGFCYRGSLRQLFTEKERNKKVNERSKGQKEKATEQQKGKERRNSWVPAVLIMLILTRVWKRFLAYELAWLNAEVLKCKGQECESTVKHFKGHEVSLFYPSRIPLQIKPSDLKRMSLLCNVLCSLKSLAENG
jgi:hypothetical protein